MKKNKIFLILIACLTLTACQSVKDGLTGAKSENSDEFLVQKKNPLVLPPKYLKLPKPKDSLTEDEKNTLSQADLEIQKILDIDQSEEAPSTQSGKAEEFVLKNIKNN